MYRLMFIIENFSRQKRKYVTNDQADVPKLTSE